LAEVYSGYYPYLLKNCDTSAMQVQHGKAIFCAISVRNQTKKVGNLNRHGIEPFDVGFLIFGLGVENFD